MSGEKKREEKMTGSNKWDKRTVLVFGEPMFNPAVLAKRLAQHERQAQNLNKLTMLDQYFQRCCSAVQIPATKRQAKKFRQRKGKAYTEGRRIMAEERVKEQDTLEHIREAEGA